MSLEPINCSQHPWKEALLRKIWGRRVRNAIGRTGERFNVGVVIGSCAHEDGVRDEDKSPDLRPVFRRFHFNKPQSVIDKVEWSVGNLRHMATCLVCGR